MKTDTNDKELHKCEHIGEPTDSIGALRTKVEGGYAYHFMDVPRNFATSVFIPDLRTQIAAMAMQGLLANSYNDGATQPLSTASHAQIAQMAVSSADALIAELNREAKND